MQPLPIQKGCQKKILRLISHPSNPAPRDTHLKHRVPNPSQSPDPHLSQTRGTPQTSDRAPLCKPMLGGGECLRHVCLVRLVRLVRPVCLRTTSPLTAVPHTHSTPPPHTHRHHKVT
ncbi:hypothetical protein BS50DRAFT_53422 [Corynespora cassiicola Philippines]|uniref:Uncharacterized protein n=1 Tax=Corynespora cassiicola Philippines TaxID=1448308 RepID=A0A2T2NIE2_CORCC|nr:hypothetical protein BS50DRAFT_53422 [Corynespora cassiicola Philippines]